MGRIVILGPDGQPRADSAFFGASRGYRPTSDFGDDGTITDLEVSDAREQLEEAVNSHDCGYGGPLGLGGLGGINEVCMQPWNMGGPPREATPDGYSMRVTVRLTEDYSEPTGILFFRNQRTATREVEMTARWENGRVRLYAGAMPAYTPPPPPPPAPDPSEVLHDAGVAVWNGARSFFSGAGSYASSAWHSFTNLFA